MFKGKIVFGLLLLLVIFGVFGFINNSARADHSWGGYHWARTSNPFTLKLGDNVSTAWDSYLATTSSDWSASSVLDTTVVAGASNKNCRATAGRVEICNSKYGNNGWLGIASVWVSGSHITQATVKMNDTYFTKPQYNTPAWKNLVMCQEVGHAFGLDHQDENFSNPNLGTCMDYTNSPETNQHPNSHDYEMLESIYAHVDSTNTMTQDTAKSNVNASYGVEVSDWGRVAREDADGKPAMFEKNLGGGQKVFTFVVWAE